jgi:hypothetical protein
MPQVLTIIVCCLFLIAVAKARQTARQRPQESRRIEAGRTTRQQAQSLLGRPASQILDANGCVTMQWSRSSGYSPRNTLVTRYTKIVFDRQGIARQVNAV